MAGWGGPRTGAGLMLRGPGQAPAACRVVPRMLLSGEERATERGCTGQVVAAVAEGSQFGEVMFGVHRDCLGQMAEQRGVGQGSADAVTSRSTTRPLGIGQAQFSPINAAWPGFFMRLYART
jgi:hypothetical protein